MKRKPNKPRPEAQTHTEPGNGAAEPGGSAFGAGSEQEPRAAGTSGQSVPKSKFRQKSQQEQAAASKLRMEKRGEKRRAAREKLAKQKPPKQKARSVRRRGPPDGAFTALCMASSTRWSRKM